MPRRLGLSRKAKNWKRKRTAEIRASLVCTVSIPITNSISLLRQQIATFGTLPNGWLLNKAHIEYIQLYQFQSNNPDVIYYSLKIKRNFSWLLHLCGQKVTAKVLESFPSTITSVEDLMLFIERLAACRTCIGNPDPKFKPLIQEKKGVFCNANGTNVIAQVDSATLERPTIRHSSCELLLLSEQATTRCAKCQGYRKSLHVMLGRLKTSKTSPTDASSHANYRYLTPAARSSRMNNLHRSYVVAKRRAVRMKNRAKELMEKEGVRVSKAMDDDLKEILKNNFSQVAAKFPANTFQRVFWNQHSQSAACKNARGVRWHPAMIRWCLYLRHLSGKAYDTLRNTGVLQLPSQRTLRDYTHYVPATIGFSHQVDKMLMDTLKVKSCPTHHLYMMLLMDEMHIKEGLVFDKHSGELVGFTNLGDMNNHIASLERASSTPTQALQPLAKSMLVLMVRGLLSGFKFPYAQFPCSSLTGDQLHNIFWEAVERLERIDIKVLGVTCDGYSVNRRFLKIHETRNANICHKMANPFAPEPRDIYYISDPPHLIKTVRNSWASRKRNLWCNGKVIDWQHLVSLYKSGTGADKVAPGLSLIPKLKYEHVYLTSYSKMRVDLASQVLSESVSKALLLSGRDDVTETAKFAAQFDKFFDVLNVKSLTEGKHKRKDSRLPYNSADDPRLDWLQNDFLKYLDEWEASVERRPDFTPAQKMKMQISQETLLGIRITCLSFVALVRYIFTIPGVKFFLSEKLSQDPLEKFFGCQRQRGSSNENPTAQQMCKNTQALRVISTACQHISKGNTRGNKAKDEEMNLEEPLMKRRRLFK